MKKSKEQTGVKVKWTQKMEERATTQPLSASPDVKTILHIHLTDSDKEAIVEFVKDHEELYGKTNYMWKNNTKKGLPVRKICMQPQPLNENVQDMVRIS